jgi:hypothetical protein
LCASNTTKSAARRTAPPDRLPAPWSQRARMPRTRGTDRRGPIRDMVSIHVRPPEIEDRLLVHALGRRLPQGGRQPVFGRASCNSRLPFTVRGLRRDPHISKSISTL